MCLLFGAMSFAQQRSCSTMNVLEKNMEKDPNLAQRMQEIESFTQKRILQKNLYQGKVDGDIITIPVVVHIIYSNTTENISDAQIQSQIDVLNEDFRRTNSDADNTWSQAADTQIEFALATVDPNGNTTTGITRKSSSVSAWEANDSMKYSSQGGVDAWDTTEYLNMWVCPLESGLLGYAQFPGGNASTDGVAMAPQYFGSSDKGSGFYLSAPFDKGRTTTHEVGHFLNLRHIWGDGDCSYDDFVDDTPSSDDANYGCSTGHTSCGSLDMVQNYMDYSDDSCMNLFTEGQTSRMRTVLEAGGSRRSLALSDKFGDGTSEPTTPSECSSTVSSFPYSESFESGDAWTQASGDDGDWTNDASGTPSSNTGPSDGADGSYYMFLEASSNSSAGQIGSNGTAILESPCFNLSSASTATFTFDNHMYGSNVGSLELQASLDGSTWVSLWSDSGDQGDQWNSESVSLGSYLGETVRLRFVGTTGDGWSSDIAIDNLSLTTSGTTGGGTVTPVTYCESEGSDSSYEWIDYVSFGGMTNTTGDNGGYADYTSNVASVAPGSSYTIIFSAGFSGTSYTEYWKVWIDYNQDGTFADSEEVASGVSSSEDNLSETVTIPSTAAIGKKVQSN